MVKILVVLVLVAVAYGAGWWPERGRRQAAEQELASLRAKAAEAEGRARVAGLLGEVLSVEEAVARQNYGDAQQLASAFYDHVRAESGQASSPAFKGPLQAILQQRDGVTAALTRADPTARETLHQARTLLRTALGYRVYGGGTGMAGLPPAAVPVASPFAPPPAAPSPLTEAPAAPLGAGSPAPVGATPLPSPAP